ncbi:carboxyltransferase domain-containing protein [Devosia oryziradicis]|uniref:Carboxyltransferase domain-containing protein n=1 Tax=Devosia oryziradicis TaxID=2801335 RepID=A0ABX7BTC4_9HYPH|nr:carboxyltransferase domain-containing protein [Devosia oryziradicis]QQR35191.1 carboxyltransferase domain-containing protein [Devosia oryziradicis]
MVALSAPQALPTPTIVPLGDSALLVRFGSTLTDQANRAAIALALALDRSPIAGVVEVVPSLVSVLLRYEPAAGTSLGTIAGELRLLLSVLDDSAPVTTSWVIPIRFDGPDLEAVSAALGMASSQFVAAHNARPLRVLATGFAPGFVYCGLHADELVLPRRTEVRPAVPPGSVLFAAGQTAITATAMPTGWHVIGSTDFANFDPSGELPTRLNAGDVLTFEVAP